MSLRNYYQQDAGRYLEVVCGVGLIAFSLLISVVSGLLLLRGYQNAGAIIAAVVLALVAWGLLRVGVRLLRGQARTGKPLLPPAGIIGGAAIFLVGGLLLVFVGITERDIRPLLGGIGILPASNFGWKLARQRRQSSALPNSSLEHSREP